MQKLAQSRILQRWVGPKQPQSNAGFTLIEMLVVVIIIAVLSAIAAPGWLAFTNRQRVNAVNGAVFQALQTAQSEAKRTKLTYSVSFTNLQVDSANSTVPYVAIYKTSKNPSATTPINLRWNKLGENQEIPVGTVLLTTNLTTYPNTAGISFPAKPQQDTTPPTTITSLDDLPKQTIIFDYMGNLSTQPHQPSFGTKGLIIAVAVNNSGDLGGSKRCVIVKTLLGAMKTYQDNDCNP